MGLSKRFAAELIGTFWLVLGGCGAAVLAGSGIGTLGIAFAFGLTVLTMAFAIGHLSGCHLNPAVTVGLSVAGRAKWGDAPAYIVAQVLGACLAAWLIGFIAGSYDNLASNGMGAHSPGGFGMAQGMVTELVMTFMFLLIILGATDKRAPAGFAPLAIGLGLTLIHLISIPVTNTSVNPARSAGPALFEGGIALQQLWLFWLFPILGAVVAGFVYRFVEADE
ncbi:MAG: aquaporin Z [Xanthomonadales bacterium]|nr:aquaporin Z [Xanthomonadales bacterium]